MVNTCATIGFTDRSVPTPGPRLHRGQRQSVSIAEQLHNEALPAFAGTVGTDHSSYATCLGNLALVRAGLGRFAEAESLYRELIEIVARTKGADSPEHASRLKQLGDLYHRMRRHSDSAERYRRALVIDQAALGFDHPTTVTHGGHGPLKRRQSPVILHIASHGYFLDDQPVEPSGRAGDRRAFSAFPAPLLNSGLALAGANTWLRRGVLPAEAEDGLLTAADLATMDLSGTELVVLSACDTGRGRIAVGQGVYGLRRSVGIAGARTLPRPIGLIGARKQVHKNGVPVEDPNPGKCRPHTIPSNRDDAGRKPDKPAFTSPTPPTGPVDLPQLLRKHCPARR
jgi:hypothetical protein